MDAYQLLSPVGEARISQLVGPNYTAVARFQKKNISRKKKVKPGRKK